MCFALLPKYGYAFRIFISRFAGGLLFSSSFLKKDKNGQCSELNFYCKPSISCFISWLTCTCPNFMYMYVYTFFGRLAESHFNKRHSKPKQPELFSDSSLRGERWVTTALNVCLGSSQMTSDPWARLRLRCTQTNLDPVAPPCPSRPKHSTHVLSSSRTPHLPSAPLTRPSPLRGPTRRRAY